MKSLLVSLIFLFSWIFLRNQRCVLGVEIGDEIEYVAAVLEHHAAQSLPFTNVTKSQALHFMMENLETYEKAAAQAKSQGAQIIVFPEDAIYGVGISMIDMYAESIPVKSVLKSATIVPCTDSSFNNRPVLQNLSCMAKAHKIAVVANMADSQSPHYYNTDVAFDTDGRLLTKYHKVHLFFETEFTPNSDPDPDSTFTTSFGVRFGLCTCYDILFAAPCFDYSAKLGVHDLVFPTAWMNASPLLYSITVQQAFAKMTDSNILAANLHLTASRFSGSGIFGRGGDPRTFYIANDSEDNEDKLLVHRLRTRRAQPLPEHVSHRVPLDGHSSFKSQSRPSGFATVKSKLSSLDVFAEPSFTYTALEAGSSSQHICAGEFCCHAEYVVEVSKGELLALGVFSGAKSGQPVEFFYQACTVVKCAGSTVSSCGAMPSPNTVNSVFRSLKLQASFHSSVDSVRLYPVVFTSGFGLVNMSADVTLVNHQQSNSNVWEMSVLTPIQSIYAGMFGRPTHLS